MTSQYGCWHAGTLNYVTDKQVKLIGHHLIITKQSERFPKSCGKPQLVTKLTLNEWENWTNFHYSLTVLIVSGEVQICLRLTLISRPCGLKSRPAGYVLTLSFFLVMCLRKGHDSGGVDLHVTGKCKALFVFCRYASCCTCGHWSRQSSSLIVTSVRLDTETPENTHSV